MKLIFAVLDVSLTMGLTRCYKIEGFFTFIILNKWIVCLPSTIKMFALTYSVLSNRLTNNRFMRKNVQ